jgi:hypothetical protein
MSLSPMATPIKGSATGPSAHSAARNRPSRFVGLRTRTGRWHSEGL